MPKLCKTRFKLTARRNNPGSPFVSSYGTIWRCLMWRSALALFASLTLLVPAGLPDSKLEVKDLQNHPFVVDFPSGSRLSLHLRSGEFRIVGHDDNKIAVHLNGRNADNARELTVRFKHWDNDADLRVLAVQRTIWKSLSKSPVLPCSLSACRPETSPSRESPATRTSNSTSAT